jgi:hypothetical protein
LKITFASARQKVNRVLPRGFRTLSKIGEQRQHVARDLCAIRRSRSS